MSGLFMELFYKYIDLGFALFDNLQTLNGLIITAIIYFYVNLAGNNKREEFSNSKWLLLLALGLSLFTILIIVGLKFLIVQSIGDLQLCDHKACFNFTDGTSVFEFVVRMSKQDAWITIEILLYTALLTTLVSVISFGIFMSEYVLGLDKAKVRRSLVFVFVVFGVLGLLDYLNVVQVL